MVSIATSSPAAFDAHVQQWTPWLRGLANRTARQFGLDRNDCFQDLVAMLFARRYSYDESRGSFPGWAALVHRNVRWATADRVVRRVRTLQVDPVVRRYGTPDDLGLPTLDALATDPGPGPAEDAERRHDAERVRAALDELPPEQLEAVRSHFWEGKPVRTADAETLDDALAALALAMARRGG